MSRPVLLLLPLLLGATGCVSHVARVRSAPVEGDASSQPSAAIGSSVHGQQPPVVEERGAQPREIPISTWRRDDEGNVHRGEGLLRTATPWWQRFPADLVSDVLIPTTFTVEAELAVPPVPVPAVDPAALADRARRAGYAAP
jgi:hypothetical protein